MFFIKKIYYINGDFMRLDVELVKRGLLETRTKAKESIKKGIVYCDNKKITKPSFEVAENTNIEIKGKILPYVSRAGLKLEKALKVFNINLEDKTMVDIGSSTGGFTDCALQNNVKKVIAIDVGTNQLDKKLRNNKKIELYEQTDFRNVDLNILKNVNIATIDVSFISVKLLTKKLSQMENLKEIICLIKPQFECGKEIADKYKGVITDSKIHTEVINKVKFYFENIGFKCLKITQSPIKGGSGNKEFLGYFTK